MSSAGAARQEADDVPFSPSRLLAGRVRAGLEHLLVKKPDMAEARSRPRTGSLGRESADNSRRLSKSPASLQRQGSSSSPSPGLRPDRRGTEVLLDRIAGFGRQQAALEKLKKIKDVEAELSVDSQDSEGKKGPYPLSSMLRDNTGLVTEDNTLLIRIPYNLDRLYLKHVKRLEQDEMDYM